MLAARRETGAEILGVWRRVSPLVLAGSVVFYLSGQALSVEKWRLLLSARGIAVSFGECARLYLAGMFGNLFLPTNIGGDALRVLLLAPRASLADAAASIAVERLTGFAALIFIAGAGLAVAGAQNGQTTAILSGTAALAGLLALVFFAFKTTAHRFPEHKIARKAQSLSRALAFYLAPRNRRVLMIALALSLIFQASQVILNVALARAAALQVRAGVFWWLAPLLSLSGLLPVGIGGLGVRETAAVALLQGQKVPVSTGAVVAWSLLWQATVWISSLPGIFFVRRKVE